MSGAAQVILRAHGGAEPRREGEVLVLDAESDYLVHGPRDALRAIVEEMPPSVVEDLGSMLRLRFGNAVGALELPGLGRVDVRSGKWGEEEFESMLAAVAERAAALPFSAGTGTGVPYDRSVSADETVLYHVFVYLRHALSGRAPRDRQILPPLRVVLRDPHRRFERQRRWVDVERATGIDARALELMVSGPEGTLVAKSAHGLPALPRRVNEACVRSTVDVPENRFVRAFLEQAAAVIDAVDDRAGRKGGAFAAQVGRQCRRMRAALQPILRHGLWNDVGPMRRLPAESVVLQQRRGYREVFRHFVRMRLASVPLPRDQVAEFLELKDIATLYELWCFFEVEQAVRAVLGAPIGADAPATGEWGAFLPYDLRVEWPGGRKLYYNRTFRRDAPSRFSYSVPLRPDVVLQTRSGRLHVLDAKFRLREVEMADDVLKDSKRQDLYKMHAYRDAVVEARTAWALYPGDVPQFFAVGGAAVEVANLLPTSEGVGAIPCVPGRENHELRTAVARLLGLGP